MRSYNCLKRVGIETIGDLVTKTENELAAIPNFGKKSIEEVKETLAHARPEPARRGRRRAGVRHRRSGRKLGRDAVAPQGALREPRPSALIEHGRIKTTAAKAKEVKPIAEQMITLGRRGGVHARRQALDYLRSQDVVHKLFSDVGAALRRPAGRLLADRPHRPAARRRGRDGLPRARRLPRRSAPRERPARSAKPSARKSRSRGRSRRPRRFRAPALTPRDHDAGERDRGERARRSSCRRSASAASEHDAARPRRPRSPR